MRVVAGDFTFDDRDRAVLARTVVSTLVEAAPASQAEVRGSLADGRADAYSDIDVLWELPDDQFVIGMERLTAILAAILPVESLRSDPQLQHSPRHRLVFVRFASLPLFCRLDLEVFARSAGRNSACDLDNPEARGSDWSVAESALANAVAALKAHLRQQDDGADALLARAFQRLGQVPVAGDLAGRIIALTRLASEGEPAVAELAERVAAQTLAALSRTSLAERPAPPTSDSFGFVLQDRWAEQARHHRSGLRRHGRRQ